MPRKTPTQERAPRSDLPAGLPGLNQAFAVLNQAIHRVEAVKYALGVAGAAAAAAIVIAFLGSWQTATVVLGGMLVAMVLLFVFARLTVSKSRTITIAGIVLLFFVLSFFCAFLVLTLTAVMFERPKIMLEILNLDRTSHDGSVALPRPYDKSYIHPRFGYLMLYPGNYFTKMISEDGNGAILQSEASKLPIIGNEVMTLTLNVYNHTQMYSPLAELFNPLVSDKNVMYYTYCALFDDRFVVSGTYYGDHMFYLTYQKKNDLLKSFRVTFPTAIEELMEDVVKKMYRSFTGELPKSKAITAECKQLM
jgi:hypothetical protein